MTEYICEPCKYSSKKKYNYNKHLKTPKHFQNIKETLPSATFTTQIPHNTTHDPHKYHTDPHNTTQIHICQYCQRGFSRRDSLTRHINKYCKQKESHDEGLLLVEYKMQLLEAEKEELKKQINDLLTRVGNNNNSNNNNTINNTIQINNYGSENLSHITPAVMTNLLKTPIGMISMLVEQVHFNPEFPENFNITIDNKNDTYAKIFKNGKWSYKDRQETIQDLVDSKYFILDSHYDQTEGKGLSTFQKNNYENFRNKYDDNDRTIHKMLNKQCELTIINNRN